MQEKVKIMNYHNLAYTLLELKRGEDALFFFNIAI